MFDHHPMIPHRARETLLHSVLVLLSPFLSKMPSFPFPSHLGNLLTIFPAVRENLRYIILPGMVSFHLKLLSLCFLRKGVSESSSLLFHSKKESISSSQLWFLGNLPVSWDITKARKFSVHTQEYVLYWSALKLIHYPKFRYYFRSITRQWIPYLTPPSCPEASLKIFPRPFEPCFYAFLRLLQILRSSMLQQFYALRSIITNSLELLFPALLLSDAKMSQGRLWLQYFYGQMGVVMGGRTENLLVNFFFLMTLPNVIPSPT